MILRPYQRRAIDDLYQWFHDNTTGHPCLVLPTGAGKSVIVAKLCQEAVQNWPQTRILMLTHSRELIAQNAAKMRALWPNAPLGVYSAGLKSREVDAITFAGIQSVRKRGAELGHQDLIIVDECHLISHKDEGGYRQLINDLTAINPALRVIGLTASPWRLGHGKITDGDALFDALIEPITILELIEQGYLAPLRSKVTSAHQNTDGVKKRGGEYVAGQLAKAVNTEDQNTAIVQEVIEKAGERKAWLFFCAGVDHAYAVRDTLQEHGINAATVTGDTPTAERDRILAEFKTGRIKAVTNCDVLTTGFDYPDIDLIAMLRPTMSPVLYVQMAGRGMRPKTHTDHCLVLDFAGNVATHGPITNVQPPRKAGNGTGDAPIKICPECFEIVHLSQRACPSCGTAFPEPEKKKLVLHQDDIMGIEPNESRIRDWRATVHTSKRNGKSMLKIKYYPETLNAQPIIEYLTVLHDGHAGNKARATMSKIAHAAGIELNQYTLETLATSINSATHPTSIKYRKNGKFYDIIERKWDKPTSKEPQRLPAVLYDLRRQLIQGHKKLTAAGHSESELAAVNAEYLGLSSLDYAQCCGQTNMRRLLARYAELLSAT